MWEGDKPDHEYFEVAKTVRSYIRTLRSLASDVGIVIRCDGGHFELSERPIHTRICESLPHRGVESYVYYCRDGRHPSNLQFLQRVLT